MWNWCWGVILASVVLSGASGQEGRTRAKRLTTFGKSAPVPSQSPSTASGIIVGAGQTTSASAKECSAREDCYGVQYTACRLDPRDGRHRCLCTDFSPPVDGACYVRPRDTRGYVPLGIKRPNKEQIRRQEDEDRPPPPETATAPAPPLSHPPMAASFRPLFWPEPDRILREQETQRPRPSSQVPVVFRPWIRKPKTTLALRSPCNLDTECIDGAECVINPNATVNHNQKMCYCMPGWVEIDNTCNGSQSYNRMVSPIYVTFLMMSFIFQLM